MHFAEQYLMPRHALQVELVVGSPFKQRAQIVCMLMAFSLKLHTSLCALLVYVSVWRDTNCCVLGAREAYKSPASQALLQYKFSSQKVHSVLRSAWAHLTHLSVFGALMLKVSGVLRIYRLMSRLMA